jgi:flagellar basal-body rod protein FlgG
MSGLIDSATAILGVSEQRIELVSQNVANAGTPGYKRQIGFASLLGAAGGSTALTFASTTDFSQGKLVKTDNPFDLAIGGAGFFQLRSNGALVYSREGQFRRAADGTLVTPAGDVLQQAGGGDLVLNSNDVKIAANGAVIDDGQPNGAVAVYAAASTATMQALGGGRYAAPADAMTESDGATVRQGMTEASNVTSSDEMVEMMAALQHAQSGARLVQVYDDLMGEALTSLGQGNR